MSGSKMNRFVNFVASKLAPPAGFEQQPYQNAAYQQQYVASQYPPRDFGQTEGFQNNQGGQGMHYNVSGQGRQHVGDHIQGDDQRTHASDQAHLNTTGTGDVYNANTYIYYQQSGGYVAAARVDQTNSAPPAANTFPPPPSRPDLPPRQESAPAAQQQGGAPDWSKVVHLASCDNCGNSPIRGIRWRCLSCPDHDLCETCKSQGHDEGHSYKPLPSLQQPPLQISSLGRAAAEGSQYGVMSQLTPGCMVEMCEQPRLDPLVLAARNGHFQVCQTLMEKLGGVYPSQCIQTAIRAARTCTTGFMGPVLAQYLESQAVLIEQQKSQGMFGRFRY